MCSSNVSGILVLGFFAGGVAGRRSVGRWRRIGGRRRRRLVTALQGSCCCAARPIAAAPPSTGGAPARAAPRRRGIGTSGCWTAGGSGPVPGTCACFLLAICVAGERRHPPIAVAGPGPDIAPGAFLVIVPIATVLLLLP
jgi:hypothetical protein